MHFVITRSHYGSVAIAGDATLGVMQLPERPGFLEYTLEPCWDNNDKNTSCIPDCDLIQLIPYISPKHGQTFCLHAPQVGVYAFPAGAAPTEQDKQYECPVELNDRARTTVEIHSANWARQLEACIALGTAQHPMWDPATRHVEPAIEDSVDAVEHFFATVGSVIQGHTLSIRPANGLIGTAGYQFT